MADVLRVNQTLTSVEYARPPPTFLIRQLSVAHSSADAFAFVPLARSMVGNQLCGLDRFGNGSYSAEGFVALVEALKVNQTLTSLKYEAPAPIPTVSSRSQCSLPAHSSDRSSDRVHSTLVCSLRFNKLDAEAAKHLSEGLQANKGLTSLEYARQSPPSRLGSCQQPLTPVCYPPFIACYKTTLARREPTSLSTSPRSNRSSPPCVASNRTRQRLISRAMASRSATPYCSHLI